MYNRNFLKYFQINKILLQFSGILPFLSWGFIVNGIFIIIPISTCLFLSLPGFYIMISRLKITSTMEILETFCELIEFLVIFFQVIVLLPKRRKIVNLVNLCNDLWENVKNEEEAQVVARYATLALYLTYGFCINVFIALFGLLVQPLFSEFVYDSNGTMIVSKKLPYSSGIFHENIRIFNIWYAIQIPTGIMSIIPIIAIATAIPFFVFHACAHFKLLQFQMSKLKSIKSGYNEKNNSQSTFAEIIGVVKQHQRVLNYSAAVEDVFSTVVLIQTILSIAAICAFGYKLLMVNGGQKTATYVINLTGCIFQLLIFCWPPNNLLSESMNIALSAYDCPWYCWTKKERKLIEIITFRSQRAAYLSAGKFSYMSLNAFSSFCGVLPFLSWGFIVNGISMITSVFSCLFLTLPAFYIIIFRYKIMDSEKILSILCDLIEIIVVAFQVILLLPKRRKLVNLVNLCNALWENVKHQEEAQIVKNYATLALCLTYGFFISVFTALLGLLLQPLFSEFVYDSNGTMIVSKKLPYPSGIFHKNVEIFNIWYALQIPAGIMSIIPIIGIDTAVAFFVFHACAHFKLLQFKISKLKSVNSARHFLKDNSDNTFTDIVEVIKQHQRVLNYSAAVEDVFSTVVLIQTILSIAAICVFGFSILRTSGGQNIATYAVHLFGGIFQLLIFCWPPNSLLFESMNIGLSAYDSPWYGWTKKERKLIEIITFRSQKPAYLSSGKFAYMSLQAFTSILSTAFSFFTLLRRVV